MRILFIDGTKGFYPRRVEEKPTGGTLTSLTLIPRYLAEKGFDVHVISEHEKDEVVDGVHYIVRPIEKNIYDVVVFNRDMLNRECIDFFKASRKVWWLHDIVDHRYLPDDAFRFVDTVVALSTYCRESFASFYGIPKSKFVVIPNGVDRSVFYPSKSKRDRNLYLHASAPIKGIAPMEFVFQNMRRISPEFKLRMYSSQKLHGLENEETMARRLEACRQAGIEVLEPISQNELAEAMRSAWALLMPNSYPEICSNLLLQAQACGLPVVASNIGSASEFITHRETGLLTKTTPCDFYWHWKDFAEQAASLYVDDALHSRISHLSPGAPRSWDGIGEVWHQLLVKQPQEVAA